MNQEKISNIIKKIRKDNNLTQKDFANKFGVTFQAVSKWENGQNIPDISILKEICSEYNIDINELLSNKIETKTNKKKKKLKITIYIILLIIFFILLFLLINKNNDFHFLKAESDNINFNLEGNIAYSNNKTIISISSIDYKGNDDTVYDKITCTLYEKKNNNNIEISKKEQSNINIKDFLSNLKFEVNDYIVDCDKEPVLYLQVQGYIEDNIKAYYIPINLDDMCLE